MRYEWYIDVFFLYNFLMDASALLFAAVCGNRKVCFGRIFIAAAGAVAISTALLLLFPAWLFYVLLVHLVLNPGMTICAFSPKNRKDFFVLLLTVYLFLFFAGGVQESLWLQFGLSSPVMLLVSGILTMALFILWQLRRRVTGRICEVDLWLGGECLSVKAYCDSGNLLRHPKNGKPVSIVEESVLPAGWLPDADDAEQIFLRTVSDERAAIRVITLDKMDIYLKGAVREVEKPHIGLHAGRLMEAADVQMLLNEAVS
ncbi:MAG: sigma-E processing peptidase SpoIIGA [Clostridiales bacterium]|nr:sigma-E processing peptidase SpoIIGA [Clostridiales bacterium]